MSISNMPDMHDTVLDTVLDVSVTSASARLPNMSTSRKDGAPKSPIPSQMGPWA